MRYDLIWEVVLPLMRRLALALLLLLLPAPALAAQPAAQCTAEEMLDQSLRDDPGLRQRMESFEEISRARRAFPGSAATAPSFLIPVAVHVIHGGVPVGTGENISDAQIASQIAALNRDFHSTGIRFALAQNPPAGASWANAAAPGVTRHASPLTTHDVTRDEAALKALDDFPAGRYLNIWVVKDILPHGVLGYARFPGTVPGSLDGIVLRHDVFGSDLLPPGGTFSLQPGNTNGKTLTHAVGHFLNLFHTFHGGCLGAGDQIADTPPEATAAAGCPAGRSTCGRIDPIHNFMDATNDSCRVAFTALQAARMRDAIQIYRASLVDPANLVSVGLAADPLTLSADVHQICAGQTVTFSTAATIAPDDHVTWSFPGGTPASASGPGPQTVRYSAPGIFVATVTLDNAAGTNPRSFTAPDPVFASSCSPIANDQVNWYFGANAGLIFSSGQPVADLHGLNHSSEANATQSNAAGTLLFYATGAWVYDGHHNLINPATVLNGHNSNSQGALSVPVPGHADRYELLILGPGDGGAAHLWSTIVDTGTSPLTLIGLNTPVPVPGGATLAEQLTAVPQCNGRDYWVIVHGGGADADKFFVYSLAASGLSGPTTYAVAGHGVIGNLKASPDGSMLAQCTQFGAPHPGGLSAALYDFDKATGAITLRQTLSHGNYGCSFSPSSKLLYMSEIPVGYFGPGPIYQYDVTVPKPDATAVLAGSVPSYSSLQLGPDKKLYISSYGTGHGTGYLSTIFNPDQRDTALQPNACGFLLNGPSLQGRLTIVALPNMIDARPGLVPADFDTAFTACSRAAFHARNCGTAFAWKFGDDKTSTEHDPTHAYAAPGTYNVTLTVTGPAGTTAVTKPVTVGLSAVSIAGPANTCTAPATYSVNAVPGIDYTWQVSGGTATATAGSDVDVVWGASGGRVSLTATDTATGCSATARLNVGACRR
jgi:PKD repeat protein